MKAPILALVVLASSVAGDPGRVSPPTKVDLDFARTAHLHDATGVGGMAHCARITDLQCARSENDPSEFRCTYRENGRSRKSAVIRKARDDWRWMAGDEPSCSILLIE